MTLLFPAIKAELLVIAHEDNTIRVIDDIHDDDVDKLTFYALAVIQILSHAHQSGVDAQKVLDGVLQLGGLKR